MKTGLRIVIIATILLLSSIAHAVSVMDFEQPPFPFGPFFNEFMHGTYTENGLRMQNTIGHYDLFHGGSPGGIWYVNVDTGSPASDFSNGPISTVRFDRFGGLFNLVSLYVIGDPAPGIGSVTSSAGGLLVFPTTPGIHTFSGSPWTNLSWVDLTSTGFGSGFIGIDDITIQAVPEPSAWLLFAGSVVLLWVKFSAS